MLTAERNFKGIRRKGVKYEERAHKYIKSIYGDAYIQSPWFQYQEKEEVRVRYCQPDGLLYDYKLRRVVIVEIKLRHTEKAWWQLRHKYGPIIHCVFPWIEIAYVEFVQWFDVGIPFPEAVNLRPAIRMAKPNEIQVTIWKP